jgi:Flp pilus assembly protein TadG
VSMIPLHRFVRRPCIHGIVRDQRGTSFIELSILLPFLLLILLGSIDMSRLISTRLDLEQAAQRTTDLALSSRPNGANGQYLVTEAAAASGLAADHVQVEIYLECDGTRVGDFNAGCGAGEQRARYVSVVIEDEVAPMFDWSTLGSFLGVTAFDSTFTIRGDSIVRFQ